MGLRRLIGDIGQWAGAVGTIGGTYIQVRHLESWAVVVVMLGALAWGAFTKVKYYGAISRGHKRRIEDNP